MSAVSGSAGAGGRADVTAPLPRRATPRRPRALSMLSNSVSLMLGKAATMGLGFLFWVLAARQFDAATVGLTAAVVAAMMLCTQVAILGVGSAVINDFPRHASQPARLLDTAFTIVVAAALAAGMLFLFVASGMLTELGSVSSDPLYGGLFLAMCVLGTAGILFDQASIALRRGDHVLVRGLVFGGVTVALIVALPRAVGAESSLAIFSPWVVAGIAACALGAVQLWRLLSAYRYRLSVDRPLAIRLFRVGLPNYALTLTERAPGLILPILVTELLSPAANATWWAVWMMAWVVFIVPISVGLALFAEGAREPESLGRATSQAVRAALGIGVLAAAVLALLAPFALSLLGPTYADAGVVPLRILVWALVPMAFVQAYFASCRARGRLAEAIGTGVAGGALSVAGAAAAGLAYGLTGMAVAWLGAQLATGMWSILRLRAAARRAAANDARLACS